MKAPTTLIVLADDRRARFLVNRGVGKGVQEVASLDAGSVVEPHPDNDERPGRQTGGPDNMARHGLDPRETAEVLERGRFAQQVIERTEKEWRRHKADRLVLAAAPKMLGELRGNLGDSLAAALYADLAKDLVKVPERELPAHFADVLAL
ncbi:host attachment protein [Albidovulum sp.]